MKILKYSVYENNNLLAVFKNEIDAINYKTLLKNLNRNAGYKDKYSVKMEAFMRKAET